MSLLIKRKAPRQLEIESPHLINLQFKGLLMQIRKLKSQFLQND